MEWARWCVGVNTSHVGAWGVWGEASPFVPQPVGSREAPGKDRDSRGRTLGPTVEGFVWATPGQGPPQGTSPGSPPAELGAFEVGRKVALPAWASPSSSAGRRPSIHPRPNGEPSLRA